MTGTLVRKILRDLRIAILVVALLLVAFQCLWVKIADRISNDLMQQLQGLGAASMVSPQEIEATIFEGPGKIMRTIIGGESISLFRITDMLSVGYVHPLMLILFSVWAIGRAAGAIAGEIDRGTMELLLAQPVARYRLLVAHLCIDFLTIPLFCLSMWAGNCLGINLVGVQEIGNSPNAPGIPIDPRVFLPGLVNVSALIFAVTGYTMWLSSCGRFRWRVLGLAVFITLVQFLINVVGQLWDAIALLRPLTVFYYYQPQQIILQRNWLIDLSKVWNIGDTAGINGVAVLVLVGVIGYALAFWTFCRRDLPAPL
jgi:ABC-2 type transport system permease protein